ncbi:MAG: eukaryotic-like serine/threonine-protein kinase [Acidobacteriota bacterium]|jgi:serine/threonine-protein kinase|nr:eukaryotic-like serine/threonine-protein kinase [Acidobacteriota bacterium]
MSLPSGTKLGPYEIIQAIGSGGMGDVYRARDSRLDRDVAVKVLPDRFARDPEARMRFEREAKAVAALTHPNILAIHDYGSTDGAAYSVTELLEGQTLRQRIVEGPVPWRKVVEIGAALADGLAAAHAKGIIHRDLKPENIFLTGDGRVKILDFGIAQLVREEPPPPQDIDPSMMPTAPLKTDPYAVVGTAGYMAPEQLRGEPVDATTDIFSLGSVLFEMATGRPAFIRATMIDSLSAVLADTPDVFTGSDRMIPYELARVIQRCIEKNRHERFQSARDLSFALRAIGTSTSLTFEAPAERKRRQWIWGSLGAAVILSLIAFVQFRNAQVQPPPRDSASEPRPIRSIAILPFVNATGDREAEYLSDGITETLINTLAQVPGLRVMSRTSVFHYKDKAPNPVAVGRDLKVSAVVVGRVEAVGDRLIVSAELVDAQDNAQLWGHRYQTARSDLFNVQQSIASEIARMLRLQLGGREQQLLTKRHTTDAGAYELYLKGRFQWNKRNAEGLYKAIELFNQAIEIDPQYANPYAGLADCYNLLDIWAGLPTNETFPRAKSAAQKALAINDQLAEAHTSLAYAIQTYEWDWPAAEREYRRAIELNPNYATARQWYSEFLTATGRFDEAELQGRKALDLDPMSPIINAVVAWNSTMARRYDAAIEQGRRTTRLFPDFMPGHAYLGLAWLESGRTREAIASLEQSQKLLDIVVVQTWLIRAHQAAGHTDVANRLSAALEQRGKREYLPPYYMAALHAHRGERNLAFAELDRALRERTGALVWLRVDPALDPLRGDARFQRVIDKMRTKPVQ